MALAASPSGIPPWYAAPLLDLRVQAGSRRARWRRARKQVLPDVADQSLRDISPVRCPSGCPRAESHGCLPCSSFYLFPSARRRARPDCIEGQRDVDRLLRCRPRPCVVAVTDEPRKSFCFKAETVAVRNMNRFEWRGHRNTLAGLQNGGAASGRMIEVVRLDHPFVASDRGVPMIGRGEAAGDLREQPVGTLAVG